MDNEKAAKIVLCMGWGYPESEIKKAANMAAEALRNQDEAQSYRTKKKVVVEYPPGADDANYRCPTCDHIILDFWEDLEPYKEDKAPYCKNCGQALDWDGEEDQNL